MATKETEVEGVTRYDAVDEPPELGSFETLRAVVEVLSEKSQKDVSRGHLNLTSIEGEYRDEELRDLAEPDASFDVCHVHAGVGRPEEIDLGVLRTDIRLAFVPATDIEYIEQNPHAGPQIKLGDQMHYAVSLDQRGDDYISDLQ